MKNQWRIVRPRITLVSNCLPLFTPMYRGFFGKGFVVVSYNSSLNFCCNIDDSFGLLFTMIIICIANFITDIIIVAND